MSTLAATIRSSGWWAQAERTPDRHFPPDASVTLTDHLEQVRGNVENVLNAPPQSELAGQLHELLAGFGLSPHDAFGILEPVALLHDIGKPVEDKNAEVPHPLTGKTVALRHPIVGVNAGIELIPEDTIRRAEILALIAEHDTPYGWYVQAQRTGQVPSRKSWGRLDAKITGERDGLGIFLLALFKLADIDGHEEVDDVVWFFANANKVYLDPMGRTLPVPSKAEVRQIGEQDRGGKGPDGV